MFNNFNFNIVLKTCVKLWLKALISIHNLVISMYSMYCTFLKLYTFFAKMHISPAQNVHFLHSIWNFPGRCLRRLRQNVECRIVLQGLSIHGLWEIRYANLCWKRLLMWISIFYRKKSGNPQQLYSGEWLLQFTTPIHIHTALRCNFLNFITAVAFQKF